MEALGERVQNGTYSEPVIVHIERMPLERFGNLEQRYFHVSEWVARAQAPTKLGALNRRRNETTIELRVSARKLNVPELGWGSPRSQFGVR